MNEREAEAAVAAHYGMLLGIQSPWKVKRARLEIEQRLVDIEVEHEQGKPVRCPQCQRECRRHDHAPERTWRHLDVMQFTTQIRARPAAVRLRGAQGRHVGAARGPSRVRALR